MYKIKLVKRATERSVLGSKFHFPVTVTLFDRAPNVEIRQKTKVDDMGNRITKFRWRCTRDLAGREDARWINAVTEWWPRPTSRQRADYGIRMAHDREKEKSYA